MKCLEFRLMSLPSVTSWMFRHSPFVADSNNGAITGNTSDIQLKDAMNRMVENLSDSRMTPDSETPD